MWIKPYGQNKFSPKSTPCVFLGYSLTQSVYICLDVVSSRVYISRHVEFIESVFPFPSLVSKTFPAPNTEPSSSVFPIASFAPVFQRPPSLESCAVSSPDISSVTEEAPLPSAAPTTTTTAPLPPAAPTNTHNMTTRLKDNIRKPNPKYGLTAVLGEVEPANYSGTQTRSGATP